MAKRIADTLHSVEVRLDMGRGVVSAVDERGRRFHFWCREDRTPIDDVLYFKAPLGPDGKMLEAGQPGYFATRQLDRTEPRNAAIIRRMWELVDAGNLWGDAKAQRERAREERDAKLAIRAQRIAKELAADELHAALAKLVPMMEQLITEVPGYGMTAARAGVLAEAHAALQLASDTTNMSTRRQELEARYGL